MKIYKKRKELCNLVKCDGKNCWGCYHDYEEWHSDRQNPCMNIDICPVAMLDADQKVKENIIEGIVDVIVSIMIIFIPLIIFYFVVG